MKQMTSQTCFNTSFEVAFVKYIELEMSALYINLQKFAKQFLF